ncbi:MAG: SRPBCC domain-containing protein [Acidobacteriia bacterium]|nr:SRPBCC domain-containing protein [Terriglobia bacterium]
MATTTITPDPDAVVAEITIAAPPERVFAALVDAKQLLRWWSSEECPAKVWQMDAMRGGKWHYETADRTGKLVINGVSEFVADGEILEYDPPRLLVYTWVANWHEQPTRRTLVRWELTPAKAGTLVKVTHSGLVQETVCRKDYSGGWPGVLGLLKKHVER